ncbi:MAG: hypothetical protein ACXAAT_14485 [Candidatus Hodarchaeales archaeon]
MGERNRFNSRNWIQQGCLWPKPTLSTAEVFTFWVNPALREVIHHLPGLYGGHTISKPYDNSQRLTSLPRKKITPRPRLVLLDIPLDTPDLTKKLN